MKFWLKYLSFVVFLSLYGFLYESWWAIPFGVSAAAMYSSEAFVPKGSVRWTVSGYTDEEVADLKRAIEETKEAK